MKTSRRATLRWNIAFETHTTQTPAPSRAHNKRLWTAQSTRRKEMKKQLTIGVIGAVVLAGVCYILWGFWIQFILLTLVYFGIALGIIFLTARYYDEHAPENAPHFEGYLHDNNTWFFTGVGAIAVTFAIACFHFGPAVLLPEKFPTPEQRSVVGNVLNHLLHGNSALEKTIPTEPLPWAKGTWFWWKATMLFLLLQSDTSPSPFGMKPSGLSSPRSHDSKKPMRRSLTVGEKLTLVSARE